MSTKRIHTVKNRRKFYIKLIAVLLAVLALMFILKQKKQILVREGTNFLQHLLSRETQLDIKVGKISGRLNGSVRFEDVRLEDPALPTGLKLIMRAKEIELRYRLVDFLTKNFSSKVEVTVTKPEIYWRSSMSLRRDRFGFFGWMREWGLSQRRHLKVTVKDLKILLGPEGRELSGIRLSYADDKFEFRLPLRHLNILGHDVSTELIVKGRFEAGILGVPDALSGEIFTEGSVVNWSPLPWESQFQFKLTQEKLEAESASFFGGFALKASVDFENDNETQLSLEARQYPLSNFSPFFGAGSNIPLEGKLDLEADLKGSIQSPNFEAYATLVGGRSGPNKYQAMNLHVEGVYPSLRLSDSRILFEDGKVMHLANQAIEFKDLFNEASYGKLVSGSDQDTVVVGNWEFRRPTDENKKPEFTLQHSFGKHAIFEVKKFSGADEEKFEASETPDMEVGFVYRLKSKDTLKFEASGDEHFVGVERKMNF